MSETTVRSYDASLILERYLSSLESSSSYLTDPFDPLTSLAQASNAAVVANLVEVTAFQVDVSSLAPVTDIRIETLSDASVDLLRALGHLSPALAQIKKSE